MSVQDHPYYDQVQKFLESTVHDIDTELESLDPPIGYGAHRYAQRALREMNLQRIDKLKESRQQAFTARIDWAEAGADLQTYYIGKHKIGASVFSWASPFAQRVYNNPTDQHNDGEVQIIMHLDVRSDALLNIYNHYVDAGMSGQLQQAQFTDSLLFTLLQGSHAKLRDIVATIQRQQYLIIQSPKDQLLIVQGAPGSGKTSIALHRVAYLLYNNPETLKASNMLILVPNRMFLRHIADILPSLGEHHVPQKTFDDWALEMLGTKPIYEPLDVSLETFFDPARSPAEKAMLHRNARNKGSLKMARMIDRQVTQLYEQVLDSVDDLSCSYPGPEHASKGHVTVTRDRDMLRALLEGVRELPYNARRDTVERQLIRDIAAEMLQPATERVGRRLTGDEIESLRKAIGKEIQKQVHQHFSNWHNQNVMQAYRQMLRAPYLAGSEIFTDVDLELFVFDAPHNQTPFRFSDLAGLLYLKLSLDGTDSIAYDHIVIDEAQDIAPLLFHVLTRYCRSSSLTVLGDIGQGIYTHHGIDDWSDIAEAVGVQTPDPQIMRESYRSTHHIMNFANQLLQRTGVDKSQYAVPINRPGPEPSLHRCHDHEELVANIVHTVRQELENNRPAIAIVCKTATSCRVLAADLAAHPLANVQLLTNRNDIYRGGIVVMPAYLTKGMEFDVVIVSDSDAATYPSDTLHARLLYVVITRAAHALHLLWTDAISPLLDAQIPSLPLQPVLNGALAPHTLTIADYVAQHTDLDVDWCVERLARVDKLRMLRNGTIDATVLALALRSFKKPQNDTDDEVAIQALDDLAQESLRQQAADLVLTSDLTVQDALALTQLTYGLLRNQMRSAGLDIRDDGLAPFDEQVVLLATLLQAVRDNRITPSAGRWTTRQSVLQSVDKHRRVTAEHVLDELLAHGMIEAKASTKRADIRLGLDWIQPLLTLGLGYRSDTWDLDLIEKMSLLSNPLDWTAALVSS